MAEETLLLVKRADLHDRAVAARPLAPLAEGQALLRVDAFALTANTITYAAFGEMLGYWRFFPSGIEGMGRPPAWGFLDVIESRAPGLRAGQRVYGYAPIGSHVIVQPERVTPTGFVDASAHRAGLPPVYNAYSLVTRREEKDEALQMLLAPLFTTSFVLDAQLAQHAEYGGERTIVSSASSKTALGLAYLLHQRGARVLGFTSPRNVAFCKALNIYDDVKTYDEVGALDAAKSAYVDFAGSAAFRTALHRRLGDAMTVDIGVGATDWDAAGALPDDLPGPPAGFFFAPDVIRERVAEWGREGFDARLAQASASFYAFARDWMNITHHEGAEAVLKAWDAGLEGTIAADAGMILRL